MTYVRISGVPDDHKVRITGLRQPYVTETSLIIVEKPKASKGQDIRTPKDVVHIEK